MVWLPEASMSSSEVVLKELVNLEVKLASAREAASAPGASERAKADLKLSSRSILRRGAKPTAGQTAATTTPTHAMPSKRWTRSSTMR